MKVHVRLVEKRDNGNDSIPGTDAFRLSSNEMTNNAPSFYFQSLVEGTCDLVNEATYHWKDLERFVCSLDVVVVRSSTISRKPPVYIKMLTTLRTKHFNKINFK